MTSSPSPRERIVATAARLFYADGIHAVGVDRVVVESEVAKATLYHHFASKDELVAACLEQRSEHWRATIAEPSFAVTGTAARRVDRVFELLGRGLADPAYRGCPFINAAAEYPEPEGPVAEAIAGHRARLRALFVRLLAGTSGRAEVANQLVILYEGAMVGAQHGDGRRVARAARRAAQTLVGAPD